MSLKLLNQRTIIFSFLIVSILSGCESKKKSISEPQYSEQALKGKQLAEKYCATCHLLPNPALLDKESWRRVLPIMQTEMNRHAIKIFYLDWIIIENYYDEASPIALEKIDTSGLSKKTGQFKEQALRKLPKKLNPNLTLVEYAPHAEILFLGNDQGELFLVDKNGARETEIETDNIPIDVDYDNTNGEILVLGIGNLYPSPEKKGKLIKIDSIGHSYTLVDSLIRPVHFLKNDFDGDGNDDFLISSFGAPGEIYSGKLSLYTYAEGIYEEHSIKELPGAIKTMLGDFNNDSKIDIMALFSQGRETIAMFLNKGNLEFEEKSIAEFPPVFGTNSFTLADVNNDTYPDIVCTQGDNGDYSPVFKNYHGVRILINDQHYQFEEKYFFPINGASKVIAQDFDKDDDIDLVVLASFSDLRGRPQENLVYLESKGDLTFESSYIEKSPSGKWLLMDIGDLDGDGYLEVIIGANLMKTINQPASYEQKWKAEKKSLLILKNQGKQTENNFWERILK